MIVEGDRVEWDVSLSWAPPGAAAVAPRVGEVVGVDAENGQLVVRTDRGGFVLVAPGEARRLTPGGSR